MDFKNIDKYVEAGLVSRYNHPSLPISLYHYTKKCLIERAWDDITLNTRHLVLDEHKNRVARGLKKFFTIEQLSEKERDSIDYQKAIYYDKLDGSCVMIFKYKDEWIFCTQKSFDNIQTNLAKEIFFKKGYDKLLPTIIDKQNPSFVFELIHPQNPIILNYKDEKELYLLGISYIENNQFMYSTGYDFSNIKCAPKLNLSFSSLEEVRQSIPADKEGYVLVTPENNLVNMVKVKGNNYCERHYNRSYMTNKRVYEYWKKGEEIKLFDDVPDEGYAWLLRTILDLHTKYSQIDSQLNEYCYDMIFDGVDTTDKKAKALWIKENVKKEHQHLMFVISDGRDYQYSLKESLKPEISEKCHWNIFLDGKQYTNTTI